MSKKIGIIGGGISGLTTAFLLKKSGFDVALFEKRERVGGNIQTIEIDGFLIEYAPNSLLKSPRLVDLIRKLNLDAEVLAANAQAKNRYVLQGGKLRVLPVSLAKMAFGNFFSTKAKLRLLKKRLIRLFRGFTRAIPKNYQSKRRFRVFSRWKNRTEIYCSARFVQKRKRRTKIFRERFHSSKEFRL